MYCWGSLLPYLSATLRYWDPAGGSGPADAQLVPALTVLSQMVGMPLGPMLEGLIGARLTALLGGVMMGVGVFLASYATSLLEFVMCYAVMFGLGVGVVYQMPFLTCERWFPSRKGAVQGAIVSGMGASAYFFNLLATQSLNPDSVDATGGPFPAALAARWPVLLRTLGTSYAAVGLVGALLLGSPPAAKLDDALQGSPPAAKLDDAAATRAEGEAAGGGVERGAHVASGAEAAEGGAEDGSAWEAWLQSTGGGRFYGWGGPGELGGGWGLGADERDETTRGEQGAPLPTRSQPLPPSPASEQQQERQRQQGGEKESGAKGEPGPDATALLSTLTTLTTPTDPSTRPRSVLADVFSLHFLLLWLMMVTSAVSGLHIISSYKSFGLNRPALSSDHFLSLVDALTALCGNAAGRLFWGALSDSYGFRGPFRLLTGLQFITMVGYRALATSRRAFALETVLMCFCMGGNFAMFPAQTFRLFAGNGPRVYAILFTGFGTAALLGPLLSSWLLTMGGDALTFNALGGLSLVSLLLCNLLPPRGAA